MSAQGKVWTSRSRHQYCVRLHLYVATNSKLKSSRSFMAFYLAAKNVANRLFQKLHDFCFNRFLCWIFIYDIFLSKRQFMLQLLFVLLDNVTEQPANSHCPLQSDAVCNRLWLWRWTAMPMMIMMMATTSMTATTMTTITMMMYSWCNVVESGQSHVSKSKPSSIFISGKIILPTMSETVATTKPNQNLKAHTSCNNNKLQRQQQQYILL